MENNLVVHNKAEHGPFQKCIRVCAPKHMRKNVYMDDLQKLQTENPMPITGEMNQIRPIPIIKWYSNKNEGTTATSTTDQAQ